MRRPFGSMAALSLLSLMALSCQPADPAAPAPRRIADHPVTDARQPERAESRFAVGGSPVFSRHDPRLVPLLRAAEAWRRARGPRRLVVDQVFLVPDETCFFEAIAAWDEGRYFPILIDDPVWSLPFLRVFRPTRVVRFQRAASAPPAEATAENPSLLRWAAALRAVSRAWSRDDVPESALPLAAKVPRHLGLTPPGLVLSHPTASMLAGAVALAAGRFQPLVEFEPAGPTAPKTFADVLSLADAQAFAQQLERRVEEVAGSSRRLGDACDFLTLAGDWPYRYRNDTEQSPFRGDAALDDLTGRTLESQENSLASARQRWAFTGRILGSPAASVYRAMCALFLRPENALLWNTYGNGTPWSSYRMTEAARTAERLSLGPSGPLVRDGAMATLSAWHQSVDPVSRFGCIFVNSSGGPWQFSIRGGTGYPADLPRGVPATVVLIHSHSAANPLDASTLAGRWLDQGAFVYYGSMNEPFLLAFRTPQLVLELAAAGLPLTAALRQGELEPFGRPWRLVYLGDPLYNLEQSSNSLRTPRQPPESIPEWLHRKSLEARTISAGTALPRPSGHAAEQLEACLDAALQALCRGGDDTSGRFDWPSALLAIDRRRLDPRQRETLTELTIDTLMNRKASDRLIGMLLAIPASDAGPRAERALETLLMAHLMSLARKGSMIPAIDLWDAVIDRPWTRGSRFPAHFTERLAGLVEASPPDRDRYVEHLKTAHSRLAGRTGATSRRELVSKELARLGFPPAETSR